MSSNVRRRKKISLARETVEKNPWLSKRAVAKHFGIARSTLYLKSKRKEKDKLLLAQVLAVMDQHPGYGKGRIAPAMGRDIKLVRRIMNKYGLKVQRAKKRPRKPKDLGKAASDIPNRIKGLCPLRPDVVWVGDFTFLDFYGCFVYLATVLDRFTREIIGWSIGLHHTAQLVLDALEDAKRKRGPPKIFHSDQGSEYDSVLCRAWLLAEHILPSQSHKAHPWENGHQESFFGRFKAELGNLYRFDTLDELIEAIHRQIHYYNTARIHTALKMTPKQKYEQAVTIWKISEKNNQKHLSTGVS